MSCYLLLCRPITISDRCIHLYVSRVGATTTIAPAESGSSLSLANAIVSSLFFTDDTSDVLRFISQFETIKWIIQEDLKS